MNKPKFLYHISNRISDTETVVTPSLNKDRTYRNEDKYVFASPTPNYISCFHHDNSIFRGRQEDIDGTSIMLVVTKNITDLRSFMRDRPPRIYRLSSGTFSQVMDECGGPTSEWVSKVEVPILAVGEIKYEEILRNAQVFYLQREEYSMEQYNELLRSMQQRFSTRRDALKYLVATGEYIYENRVAHINDKWLGGIEIEDEER